MPEYLLHGPAGSDKPVAMTSGGQHIGEPIGPDDITLAAFSSHSWDAAVPLFHAMEEQGIQIVLGHRHGRDRDQRFWRFPGAVDELDRQAIRFAISQSVLAKASGEGHVHGISGRIGQVYGRYQKVRNTQKPDGTFTFNDARDIKGILDGCEGDVARLHAMAAATQVMVDKARFACNQAMTDEVRAAFDLGSVNRTFRVVADSDPKPPPPLPDPLAIRGEDADKLRAEIVELRAVRDEAARTAKLQKAEVARLVTENADLAGQLIRLTSPVTPIEPEAAVPPVPEPKPPLPLPPVKPANPPSLPRPDQRPPQQPRR